MSNPKHIRALIHVREACELDPEDRYHELLDIIIDHFGVRHIEKLEDKIIKILESKQDGGW